MKEKLTIGKIVIYLILILFAASCLYPILWMVLNSFKTNTELFQNPWGAPNNWDVENYERALVVGSIGVNFMNSVYITVASVAVSIFLSTMCSYGLVRMKWRLSGAIRSMIVIGMSIPTYTAIVPLFLMFFKMKLINEYPSVMIAHICFAIPLSIFIISGFMSTIPKELEEAAVIDGCSIYSLFFRIIFPVSVSSIVTVAVINFINVWNDLLFAQIFLTDLKMMPLPVGLTMFNDLYSTDYVGQIAAVVFTVIPTIIVYCVLHEHVIEGMTAGAVKG